MPMAAGLAAVLVLSACGGGEGSSSSPSVTTTTAIEGVQTFPVVASHTNDPVAYPQVPPVGGAHNPVWQACGFYDKPVQSEKAVHSMEHGAIWITYRPDVPAADVELLSTLARSRKYVLVSRWDDNLPAPLVATAWGRQLRLESATDPRLMEFVRQYTDKGPEPGAPC